MKKLVCLFFCLLPFAFCVPAHATTMYMYTDGTNLYFGPSGSLTNLGLVPLSGVYFYCASNNTANGGTTNAFDAGSFSNLIVVTAATLPATTMTGNINGNGNWYSGDGDNEGVWVDSEGSVTIVPLQSAPYNSKHVFNNILSSYYATNSSAQNLSWNCYRSCESVNAPTPTILNQTWNLAFRTCTGNQAFVQSGVISFLAAETNSLGHYGSKVRFYVTPIGGVISTGMDINDDRSLKLYNMTSGPTTAAGYAVFGATNGEMMVWDSSGNKTQLSPHNDKGEWTPQSENRFSGVREVVNQTVLAKALESMLPALSPYKGKIYSVSTNAPEDWRANELRAKAEADAAIAAWNSLDPTNKLDTPQPQPYVPRPIPPYAVEAQKQFDGKYVK